MNEKENGAFSRFFKGFFNFVSESIAQIIFFIFFLFFAGAVFGFYIALNDLNPFWVLLPLLIGLVALYNQKIAILLFILGLIVFL
jgi:hypothetical protein